MLWRRDGKSVNACRICMAILALITGGRFSAQCEPDDDICKIGPRTPAMDLGRPSKDLQTFGRVLMARPAPCTVHPVRLVSA
jgi:hypothetical protein